MQCITHSLWPCPSSGTTAAEHGTRQDLFSVAMVTHSPKCTLTFHLMSSIHSFLIIQCVCVCVCVCVRCHVQLFATPWTEDHQASLSMGFSRQEYLSGLPCLFPGDLPDPGIKPASLMSFALAGRLFTTKVPSGKPHYSICTPNSHTVHIAASASLKSPCMRTC